MTAKAADWIDISEDRLRKTAEKSKVVFVLHWSEPANDYVMEVIKGFPEPKRFIPALTSWRTFTERIYADPFATPTKPQIAIVMMEDPDPNSEYYAGYAIISVSHKEENRESISADAALAYEPTGSGRVLLLRAHGVVTSPRGQAEYCCI